MKLREYIDQICDGNASLFARHHGTTKQQVQRWLNYDCIWYQGQIWQQKSKFN